MKKQETKKKRRIWSMLIFVLCCLMFAQAALAEEPEDEGAVNEGEVNEGAESGNVEEPGENEEKEIESWNYDVRYNSEDQTVSWVKCIRYTDYTSEEIPLEGMPEFEETDRVRINFSNWREGEETVDPITIKGDLPIVDLGPYNVVIIDGNVKVLNAITGSYGDCTVTGDVGKIWINRHGGDIWIQGTLEGGEEWDHNWTLDFDYLKRVFGRTENGGFRHSLSYDSGYADTVVKTPWIVFSYSGELTVNGKAEVSSVPVLVEKAKEALKNLITGTEDFCGIMDIVLKVDGGELHDNFGMLTLSFGIGTRYAGREAVVYHLHEDGTVSNEKVTVDSNGAVSITVTDLSCFMIVIPQEGSADTDQDTPAEPEAPAPTEPEAPAPPQPEAPQPAENNEAAQDNAVYDQVPKTGENHIATIMICTGLMGMVACVFFQNRKRNA